MLILVVLLKITITFLLKSGEWLLSSIKPYFYWNRQNCFCSVQLLKHLISVSPMNETHFSFFLNFQTLRVVRALSESFHNSSKLSLMSTTSQVASHFCTIHLSLAEYRFIHITFLFWLVKFIVQWDMHISIKIMWCQNFYFHDDLFSNFPYYNRWLKNFCVSITVFWKILSKEILITFGFFISFFCLSKSETFPKKKYISKFFF